MASGGLMDNRITIEIGKLKADATYQNISYDPAIHQLTFNRLGNEYLVTFPIGYPSSAMIIRVNGMPAVFKMKYKLGFSLKNIVENPDTYIEVKNNSGGARRRRSRRHRSRRRRSTRRH